VTLPSHFQLQARSLTSTAIILRGAQVPVETARSVEVRWDDGPATGPEKAGEQDRALIDDYDPT